MSELREKNRDYYFSYAWLRDKYRDINILKYKTDLEFYKEQIEKRKPEFIVETGTLQGGSALYFQDIMGDSGQVITIDVFPQVVENDPRIKYIKASSTDTQTVAQVKDIIGDKKVMVILDADHSRKHVAEEIKLYSPLVSKGQMLVVEDTMFGPYLDSVSPANGEEYPDGSSTEAVEEWDKKGFKVIPHPEITMNPDGWFVKL